MISVDPIITVAVFVVVAAAVAVLTKSSSSDDLDWIDNAADYRAICHCWQFLFDNMMTVRCYLFSIVHDHCTGI
jgi:hypothetical protein